MVMLVDTTACQLSIGELSDLLDQAGKERLCPSAFREKIFLMLCIASKRGG